MISSKSFNSVVIVSIEDRSPSWFTIMQYDAIQPCETVKKITPFLPKTTSKRLFLSKDQYNLKMNSFLSLLYKEMSVVELIHHMNQCKANRQIRFMPETLFVEGHVTPFLAGVFESKALR